MPKTKIQIKNINYSNNLVYKSQMIEPREIKRRKNLKVQSLLYKEIECEVAFLDCFGIGGEFGYLVDYGRTLNVFLIIEKSL